MKNLIPSFGGKLVDADEVLTLIPLMAGDGESIISRIMPKERVTRKNLQSNFISEMSVVSGERRRIYSKPHGGTWYIVLEDGSSLGEV